MATTKVALASSIAPEVIQDMGRVTEAFSSAPMCRHCRKRAKSDFAKFLDAFVHEVEERVENVGDTFSQDFRYSLKLDLID